MRRRIATALIGGLAAAAALVAAAPAGAATLCVNPGGTGGCYAAIQGAIGAATGGDTIQVAAGTYNESTIVLNKNVSIEGAGPGQTIVDGQNVSPSATGMVNVTAPGAAGVSGMTLRNAGLNMPGTRVALFEKATAPGATYTFANLAIEGVGDGTNFDKALYSFNSQASLILRDSTLSGTGGNPIALEQHSGSVDIDGNTISPGTPASSGSSIAIFTYGGVNVTSPQLIRNNTITGRGVSITGAFGNLAGSGTFSDAEVTGNDISGLVSGNGVALANGDTDMGGADGVISNAEVADNRITGSNIANPRGVNLSGLLTGTDVTANNITNFAGGMRTQANSGGSPGGTVAAGNRFVGNTIGIEAASGSVDAEHNWWGCNGGPGAAGCDTTTGTVDTDPHLVLGLALSPSTIPSGTSAATASVRGSSSGPAYTGDIFSGPSTTFATTRGSIAPASVPLSDGEAASTLDPGAAPGTGIASATLDNATATANFEVPAGPDTSVTDPFLQLPDPQKVKGKKVRVKVIAGAGEPVTATAYGVVRIKFGNALGKVSGKVAAGQRSTLTLKPRKARASKRIRRALDNDRKVTIELTGKLTDVAGNEYTRDLTARLVSG